ncbi:hypothetical protein MBT84_49055 [Streptomyces sp. MBT84]|nr:hypothetical protein [Streptomyces sp. MBT84]
MEIPPPLDGMIRELVHHSFGKAHRLEPVPSPWLFPGPRTGRSMGPVSLSRRLKVLGIRPRPTRNASLMDLATELPAFVFSRVLGFSEQTAAPDGREWLRRRPLCRPPGHRPGRPESACCVCAARAVIGRSPTGRRLGPVPKGRVWLAL